MLLLSALSPERLYPCPQGSRAADPLAALPVELWAMMCVFRCLKKMLNYIRKGKESLLGCLQIHTGKQLKPLAQLPKALGTPVIISRRGKRYKWLARKA